MVKRLTSLVRPGHGFRIIDLAVNYDCNLECDHCSAKVLERQAPHLDLSHYRNIVRQAKELDNLSWNITGGEPLLWDDLDRLIPILEPERHYISIQTNGYLLTMKRAGELAGLGVNCITTSLDSAHKDTHNRFRGNLDSYDRVLAAVDHAKKAGMRVLVGGTVSHDNLRSGDLEDLIRLVNGMGAIFLFNLAVPCGNWANQDSMVIRGDDRAYLAYLMDKYPATSTDHEPGRNAVGCPASMEKIYITPYGDVLPCPFIHVSFGNVKQEELAVIVRRMRKDPYLKGYPPICVAAEDRQFQQKVLHRIHKHCGGNLPVDYRELQRGNGR